MQKARFQNVRLAGLLALWFGFFYALMMVVLNYSSSHPPIGNLGFTGIVSFLYCAVPLFVVFWPLIGLVNLLRRQ